MKSTNRILGQKVISLADGIIKKLENNTLTRRFYITDLGFYPTASNHYRINEEGNDSYLFIYCTIGKGSVIIGGREELLEPNQFCIIPKNVKYEFKSDESDPWSIYWFYYNGSLASEFYKRYELRDCKNIPYSLERIQVFEKVFNLLEGNKPNYLLEYANLLCFSFLGDFIYNGFDDDCLVKKKLTLVDSIKKYLLDNLEKNLSLEDITKQYNFSKSYLQSKFKKETGYTIYVFFILKKMQKACEYLSYTELNIKEISFKLGIEDPLYFSRLFKKNIGKCPSEYRKESA